MKKKLHKLEAIRGFAAVYVVCSHLFSWRFNILGHNLSFLFRFGNESVILFFILSGFVIHYSFQGTKDKSFFNYFKKRFFRIYIPLIVVFILNYLLYINFKQPGGTNIWKELTGNVFMLQDLKDEKPNVICDPFLNNAPLWSLSYEWWFYMIYFVIYKYWNKNAFQLVIIIAVISTLSYIVYPFFINRLGMYMVIWWSGVEIATLYRKDMPINFINLKKVFLVISICCVLLVINCLVHRNIGKVDLKIYPYLELRHMTFTLVALSISLLWKKYNWFLFDKTIGAFSIVAPISYTIYISHFFLIVFPDYLYFINDYLLKIIIGTIICLIFSYLIEIVVYRTIIKYLK